jgi:hypothetical protein
MAGLRANTLKLLVNIKKTQRDKKKKPTTFETLAITIPVSI